MKNHLLLLPGEHIILTEDVELNLDEFHLGKWQIARALDANAPYPVKNIAFTLPAGTVVEVSSYRLLGMRQSKYAVICLLVKASPEKRFLPKSRGGTGRRVMMRIPVHLFVDQAWERVGN